MQNLRRHEFDATSPIRIHLAADARMSRTDYADDQAWSVELGTGDRAALAFQTRYGGRAGLVSLVPIWQTSDKRVYQQTSYHRAPIATHFAPNLLRVVAEIVPDVKLEARFWVMESHVAGGEFTLVNAGDDVIELQLELFGHVALKNRNRKLNILTLADYSLALHLGQIGNINPVVTLEGASHAIYSGRISSPKLGCEITLEPGQMRRIPFATAGLPDMRDSHSVAMNWMSRAWEPYFERIDQEAGALPTISTGHAEWDRLIDLSQSLMLKSIMRNSNHLPHFSFVANRASNRGWSRRGDGSDHIRAWSGQDPTLAYGLVGALTGIRPEIASGIVRNYLATQDESGFVDRQPGLAGQRQGLLMMPILARMAWRVYEHNEDKSFVAELLPKLLRFFERWLQDDCDVDNDGIPEWQSERQLGYVAFPTFGVGQGWSQEADIRQMETPDLLAYLITEADALCNMARLLEDDPALDLVQGHYDRLIEQLETFWNGTRYVYRDRDSHQSSAAVELLYGGAGDQLHKLEQQLSPANRVVVRIVGGVSQRPRIQLRIRGTDEAGETYSITADAEAIDWHNRQGIYTTDKALSYVDSIEVNGLSRVYKIYAKTIDCSRLDINHLLPLWTGALPEDRTAALVKLATDEAHFWRPNGLTMVSAADPNFDPSNARGGGGIWMYWLSLIGEGMVKSGYHREATDLVRRVLAGLCRILQRDGHLSQFYHADDSRGFGEDHHIGGIVPLALLNDAIGVRIVSPQKVWVGGPFTWDDELSVVQHGVKVLRNTERIQVDFPSGHSETLPADAEWQALVDPTPVVEEEPESSPPTPDYDLPSDDDSEKPVVINVDDEDLASAADLPGDETPDDFDRETTD